MRFTSSLVAFVYFGFAAAAVIPAIPTQSTTIVPVSTPDIAARAVNGVPANLGKLPTSVPLPTSSVIPKVSGVPNLGSKLPVGRRASNVLSDVLTSAGSLTGGKAGKASLPVRRDDESDLEDCEDEVPETSVPVSTAVPSVSPAGRRAVDPSPTLSLPTTTIPTPSGPAENISLPHGLPTGSAVPAHSIKA